MKNKLFTVLLCICTLFSAFACAPAEETEGVNVVCTIFPQYDFARNIAGDNASVTLLVPPGKEAHSYEATVYDVAKLRRADLLIYVGGDVDGWVLDAIGDMNVPALCLTSLCGNLEGACDADEHDGHDHGTTIDPHVWTSPKNAIIIANAIGEALISIDAENDESYAAACADYVEKLKKLDAEYEAMVAKARNKTIVFAEKFPFRYLCDHYGISHYSAFEGCSTQSEPGLATLVSLARIIKDNGLNAVLTVEFSTATVADWLAKETGANIMRLHSCHSLTAEEFKAGESYISLMEENLRVLEEAMK